ncbi:hypothetical protein D9758_014718 [Tetrapyrgos nigripes]|uniref:Glycine-rich protein n=1 Tax=Tetrapyrgos nigripes TaxID=182062 RepID=A0A8H5CBQ0_9AGAR|nr:hypothetical protein D9758_014718 [Tetrapyrgos nigripes]
MFVPFISSKYSTSKKRRDLERRKGGGGGGKGGSGSGRASGGSSGSGGGSSGRTSSINTGGGSTRSATSFGNGGGPVLTIPAGSAFAGRTQGGATRDQVYGTSTYGSGYPGISGAGVASRGFPFYFWPLGWGGAAGLGSAAYLHNREYGDPDNSTRPGGPMMFATFVSSSQNTTFHVVADNTTVIDLISDISANCSSSINNSSSTSTPQTFNDSSPTAPNAQSVIQYYRASSVALTLDGYNNSATWGNATESTPDSPLPSNIDNTLKDCLNLTIGAAVPLVDGAGRNVGSMSAGIVPLLWVVLYLSGVL